MKRRTISILAIAVFASGFACESPPATNPPHASACPSPAPPGNATQAAAKVSVATTGVRSITLPVFETELPPGPGKITVLSSCTLCHSQRYVLTQPNFPKKTWIAEVDKMRKIYGAPIQDEQVEPIVNYLVSVRGNGQ